MMCSLCERQWNRTLSNAGGALLCLTRTGYQRPDSLDRWKFRILHKFYCLSSLVKIFTDQGRHLPLWVGKLFPVRRAARQLLVSTDCRPSVPNMGFILRISTYVQQERWIFPFGNCSFLMPKASKEVLGIFYSCL